MSEALNNDNNDTTTQAPPRLETASLETENTVVTASPQSFSEPAVYGHSYQTHTISGGHNILGNVYFGAASDLEADLFSRTSAVKRQATGPSLLPKASISFFTGRRLQLEQLETWLLEPMSNVLSRKVVVVHGLGGSGKTQFCLRYAEQKRSRYWGVFWIDASSLKAADRCYEQIGDIFRKGATPAGGRFWLTQQHQPWLMIVDNADDPDLDMPSVLPIGTRGHILITSRNPNVKDHATAGTIHLTKMEPEEAIDLLLCTAYPDDASARARNTYRNCAMGIAEQLGYLAIALRHAGSTIRRKIYTIEKYLSLYLARRGYLIKPRMSLNDKEADIITTWEIPFQRLENRASRSTSHQDAVALLHLFAFLHHQAIPQTLLQAPWFCKASNVMVPNNVPEILQCMNEDHEVAYARLRHALNILYDYSIIEFDDHTGVCSLHPVIHEWARSRIDNSRMVTQWLCFTAFLLACSGHLIESGGRTSAIALLPHVDRFVDLAKHFDPSLLYTGDSVFHIEDISRIYERAGKWRQSLDLLLPIIGTHTKVYGSGHSHTLRVKRNASLCYWNLFEVGHAVQLQNEIRLARWTARPKLLDWLHPLRPMHIDYLISLSDLTQTLWLAGQHRLSQIAGERAMTGLSRDLGRTHLLTLDATFNLGRTYRHLGMLTEAHLLLVFVLQQRKQTLGLDHSDTLMVKNEVAMNFCSRRVFLALSEKWVREVHASRSHLLGEEHAYTLWSINDLAKILSARERPAEAASLLEEAIPAVDRTLGHKHVGMLMTKGNLARAYAQLDRCSDAAHVLEEIIPDMDQRHPDWTYSTIGLIRLYIRLERLDEAEDRCTALLFRLVARGDSPTLSPRYLSTALFTTLTRFMLANNSKDLSNAANARTTASLLAEIYLRRQDEQKLNALRLKYPDMIEGVMDMPFVPT